MSESFRVLQRNLSFQIVDVPQDLHANGVADAGGTCLLAVATVPSDDQIWLVERIVIAVSGSALQSTFGLYRNTTSLANRVDWTDAGNADIAEENQPIRFVSGDQLLAQWLGLTPTVAQCYIAIQYSIARLVG